MRVCLVSYEYPPYVGGEASYTHGLAVGLTKLGHEVLVVVPDRPGARGGPPEPAVRRTAVRFMNLPLLKVGSFLLEARKHVRRFAREKAIDLVHFTFDYPSLPVRLSGLGVPTVATVHHLHQVETLSASQVRGTSIADVPRIARGIFTTRMEKALLADADSVIAVSAFTKDSLARYAGVGGNRVQVIPNGIDPDSFLASADKGALRTRLGLGPRPVVLYVGRLDPSKGVEYLIRAFRTVKGGPDPPLLVVVGSGSSKYSAKLREMAASSGLRGAVVFAGHLNQGDLLEAYALASVVALPSLMEGFGITLLEAMASGRPCVATTAGAIPEIVLPGRTGVLVRPADSDGLSRAINQILEDPAEARLMGERGRRFVLERYTLDEMVRRTEAVYRELVEGRAPKSDTAI